MGNLVRAWEQGFLKYQPDVKFDHRMYGTASSIGALYAGVGNLAIRGEEIHPFELHAFERVMRYEPLEIDVATGSLDVRNMDFAQVYFVNKDNPISKLTLAQLASVFAYGSPRSARDVRTWDQLGLSSEWVDKPIHLYAWKLDDDFTSYLQDTVLNGGHKWKCNIHEYAHIPRADGTTYDSGQQIIDAVGRDRYGIGVSNVRYATDQVKALALAMDEKSPYYAATKENLISQKYPLTRIVPAYVNRAPGEPIEPCVREFLRYILSREGQNDIEEAHGYLPLSTEAARGQLKKLDTTGTVRVWGTPQMKGVIERWSEHFQKTQPSIHIAAELMGTDTAMAGLYTGVADIAVMGRPATPKEIMAFEWVFKYKPLGIAFMTGSLNAPGKSPALAVFVHHDNPISKVTLAELDAIFGCEHLRGNGAINTWAQLGVDGALRGKPIHAYGFNVETGSAAFFKRVVMTGSGKWNWPDLREFNKPKDILDALAKDPAGIGVADLTYSNAGVKAIAVSADDERFYEPTRENLIAQRYPLTRIAFAYVNRRPGESMRIEVKELLQYVLSTEGQKDVLDDGGYLPLNDLFLQAQRDKLP